ncbi:MAG: isochorismatase family protein [Planctomycetes bacterium]|nr:isochorismatase family protein [Planctomycetota bacterium]
MSLLRICRENLAIVLIDVQDYFLQSMCGDPEPLLVRLEQILIISEWFDLPVLATLEEPIERKGRLPERLQRLFPERGGLFPKQTYNLCAEDEIKVALSGLQRRQMAVVGGETDVCVLQSVSGMLSEGFDVFLLEDCLYSSEPFVSPALERMTQSGAVPCTYKSLFYELCGTEDPAVWEDAHQRAVTNGFIPVESLPPRKD